MNDFANFRSFERSLLFWLGADAATVAAEHITRQQQAREVSLIVDTSEVDHDE